MIILYYQIVIGFKICMILILVKCELNNHSFLEKNTTTPIENMDIYAHNLQIDIIFMSNQHHSIV